MAGGIADGLIKKKTIINYLIAGSRASYLDKILIAFFLLNLDSLTDPALLIVELLFTGNLVEFSTLRKNSNLSALLLLIELLTLAKLTALIGELLFINTLAGLTLTSLTLKVGLVPIEGLAKLVILIAVEPIFVDGLVLLALLNYSAKSPFIGFSSLKLSRAIAYKKSTSFFLKI